MSTRDPGVTEGVPPSAAALVPRVGEAPSLPTAALGSTPGAALAGARVPGAPTVPDADPTSFGLAITRLANELFAAPPAPAVDDPITNTPTAPNAPAVGSVPTTTPPESASAAAVPTSGAYVPPPSPFSAPLDFDAIARPQDPFATLSIDALNLSLLDPRAPTPEVPPALDVAHPSPAVSVPVTFDAFEIAPTEDASVRSLDRAPFDANVLKREFPILQERVRGRPIVWLDNAATTQKPQTVIDRISYFYEHENSNVHRAAHTLAARATDAYESARESVKRFIKASSTREIVFVRGTTEGINLIAQSWGRRNVAAGDEILITWLEHHANIVPWQMLASEKDATLKVAPVDDSGQVILEEYEKLLGPKTKLVSFTQVSNALGTITPSREMIEMAHRYGAITLLDGAQSVSHMPVDVQSLGCDFFVFSGHKVFGPTGIGAVYGRADVLDSMPPWQGGGNMIEDVTFERTRYQPAPARFEAGTGNIADAVGLGAALDWLTRVGVERVERYEHELLEYATHQLSTVPGLRMIGTAPNKAGVLSFVLAGQKTEQVGGMLDQEGIAVRSGHHCAQPILRRFGLEATVRASLAAYNDKDDVDALTSALRRIQAGKG